jgi:hypothetical protein
VQTACPRPSSVDIWLAESVRRKEGKRAGGISNVREI